MPCAADWTAIWPPSEVREEGRYSVEGTRLPCASLGATELPGASCKSGRSKCTWGKESLSRRNFPFQLNKLLSL